MKHEEPQEETMPDYLTLLYEIATNSIDADTLHEKVEELPVSIIQVQQDATELARIMRMFQNSN